MGEITQFLSLSIWLFSLSMIFSRSIHVVTNGNISSFPVVSFLRPSGLTSPFWHQSPCWKNFAHSHRSNQASDFNSCALEYPTLMRGEATGLRSGQRRDHGVLSSSSTPCPLSLVYPAEGVRGASEYHTLGNVCVPHFPKSSRHPRQLCCELLEVSASFHRSVFSPQFLLCLTWYISFNLLLQFL